MSLSFKSLLELLYDPSRLAHGKRALYNMLELKRLLNHPDKSYLSVHIAGTNGKGSVAHKIANCLHLLTGKKVGLFTSPHLFSYRERFHINGKLIDTNSLIDIIPSILKIANSHRIFPTFFELTTATAMVYFKQSAVDYAVFEVGIGGKLDATNVINPALSIITSIGLDHTAILGNDINLIAKEKAGIIKSKVPILVGPTVPINIIYPIAHKVNAPLHTITTPENTSELDVQFINNEIAKKAIRLLLGEVDEKLLEEAVSVIPPCRMQDISKDIKVNFPVIVDVAHNPAAISALIYYIKKRFSNKFRVVIGISRDKDISGIMKVISSFSEHIYIVSSSGLSSRLACVETLKSSIPSSHNCATHVINNGDVKDSLITALNDSKTANDGLLICGSFFIIKDVFQSLSLPIITDPSDATPPTGVKM